MRSVSQGPALENVLHCCCVNSLRGRAERPRRVPRDEAASGNTLRGARMTASGKVAPRHFERLDWSLWADRVITPLLNRNWLQHVIGV